MNITLTPEMERLVHEKVASGLYDSAIEVVREALRLLGERDQFRKIRLDELRRAVAVGIAQADQGDLTPRDGKRSRLRAESGSLRSRDNGESPPYLPWYNRERRDLMDHFLEDRPGRLDLA